MSDSPFPSFGPDYYTRASESITRAIEQNWMAWTVSEKRYMLVTKRCVIEGDLERRTGTVTNRLDFHVSSDSVEDLCALWRALPWNLDTTYQHFIVDVKEHKVVSLLSICA